MGTLIVRVSDELEREFRKAAFEVFGQRKGSLSRAVEDAIRLWLASIGKNKGVSFRDLEVKIPPSRRDIVEKILDEVNEIERMKIDRLLKAIGVSQ